MPPSFPVHELADSLRGCITDEVRSISHTLSKGGFRSWVVGGCVRDVARATLSGTKPQVLGDWDLATDARPEQVTQLFRRVIPTGVAHGTVTVVKGGQHFEITTLRGERGHSDGRRPDQVYFVDDLKEDLARRDFTVNAMAYNVMDGTFSDPFDGMSDLVAGVLRAVGEPLQRFSEDGLRVLRCARFCATLGLDIEEGTRRAILPSLASFEKVAQERVADEWFKALVSPRPSRFFRVITDHGMLGVTAPALWTEPSTLLSFDEAMRRVDEAPKDPMARLALFVRAGTGTEIDPEGIAKDFARRLRLSNEKSAKLVQLCSFGILENDISEDISGFRARKWLSTVGRHNVDAVLAFQKLVRPDSDDERVLSAAHDKLRAEISSGCPLTLKELAVSGADLMRDAGIEKGPRLGKTLATLLDAVLHDPSLNDRQTLLRLASEA